MVNPVPGYSITTPYGRRGSYWSCNENSAGDGVHTGADFAAPAGTRVVASIRGQVRHRNYGTAFGGHQFAISPDPGDPFGDGEVFYAHTRTRLADGTWVDPGDKVAEVGSEGNVTGPHLHYEYHPHSKGTWSCSVHANPQPTIDHGNGGSSGGGGESDYPKPTSKTVYLSKLKYGVEDSDSVWYLQDALNDHPLDGGATLPTTGGYFDMTDAEVIKCQEQHGFGSDPPGQSFVGPSQADHLFAGRGLTVINDTEGSSESPPNGGGGDSTAPPLPPRTSFSPGQQHSSFTWMGERFLDWLDDDEIAHAGSAYEPGPIYSTYDDENVRLCQSKMGDVPDPAGSAYFGQKQWDRLAGDPPDDGGESPTPPPAVEGYEWHVWLAEALRAEGCTVAEEGDWQHRGRWNEEGDLSKPRDWDFVPDNGLIWHHTATESSPTDPWPSEDVLINGRSDLPGPLYQLSPDHVGVVHVVAAGRANHAGKTDGHGHTDPGDGNAQTFGIGIDYSGYQALPPVQYEASIKSAAAICRHQGWGADYAYAHAETSETGKWDPGAGNGEVETADMVAWRADLAACLALPPGEWSLSGNGGGGSEEVPVSGALLHVEVEAVIAAQCPVCGTNLRVSARGASR